MTGPAPFVLNYSLSSDPAHTINWGNTVGTDTVSGTGTGGLQIITVYGFVPACTDCRARAATSTRLPPRSLFDPGWAVSQRHAILMAGRRL